MFSLLKKRMASSIERFGKRVKEREISEKDIDEFISDIQIDLLSVDISLEVVEFLRQRLKGMLVGMSVKRSELKRTLAKAIENVMLEILNVGSYEIKSYGKGTCVLFLGFNGTGKTTTLAKIGKLLMEKGYSVVFAAGDTFRAASIEQLAIHSKKLGVKLIKHSYGADPAAVIFDAIKHAKTKGIDFVLADTAGRSHSNKNLMEELKKIVRVNNPEIKLLILDSLSGIDAIEQAKMFNDAVGIDAMIFTKADVNEKGGIIISVCHEIKKPIAFLCTGQGYEDIKRFEAKEFLRHVLPFQD